jgi:hypothetical protein
MHVNLLPLYNLYLIIIFALGTAVRYRLYIQVISLVLAFPSRWPKLGQLLLQHRWMLIGWRTLLPTVLTLLFTAIHSFVLYWLLPSAVLTPLELRHHLGWAVLLAGLALAVILLDGFSLYVQNQNWVTPELQKQFDQAEFWLSSRWSTVIEWLSFKKVRPRQLVQEQLRAAMEAVAQTVNWALWYWAAQLLARALLALALWTAWFFLRS